MAAASLSATLASSATSKKHTSLSVSVISIPQSTNLQLGICKFSTWNGLKHQGVPTSRYIVKIERRGRCRGKGVYASLFGVGAPEVLVIGVVALLVFGPKGLAEVARNIGKSIRAFQPTIRELQEVSRELKSTLEREIGLDEIQDVTKTTLDSSSTAVSVDSKKDIGPNGSPSSSNASLTDVRVKTAEELLEASAAQQQKETASAESPVEPENQTQVADGSPSSTEADSTMEYLKKLEKEWEALNSEKRKKMASAATEVNTQDVSPSSTNASLNEEHVKTAEEQLEASAAQQQEETASAEIPVKHKGQSQVADGSPSSTEEDSIQEYLKKLEQEWEAFNSEKQKRMASAAIEVKSQVSDTQEAASATPLSEKPESEDQMSEKLHDDDRSSVEHQLL